MVQVYNVIPYLQEKLARTIHQKQCLSHPDVVILSDQLDRYIVQEQCRLRHSHSNA